MVKKEGSQDVTEKFLEYARHIKNDYTNVSLVFEPHIANALHESLPFPVYASDVSIPQKIDLVTTLGGDGTILHATSLFSRTQNVPPLLSFSMGTLGFLGEWKKEDYKRAFREVYMSGATGGSSLIDGASSPGWSSMRGKAMGSTRGSKILMRNRLRVAVYDAEGNYLTSHGDPYTPGHIHAMNEVVLHRGAESHLVVVEVYIAGKFLTTVEADGIIVATPSGSTAYSLSAGGSIVHPLCKALLVTSICSKSWSFRPLVLPSDTEVKLRISEKSRGKQLEISVDGRRRSRGLGAGMEIVLKGEDIKVEDGCWIGGVPCVNGSKAGVAEDDGWVGGLDSLLKLNYLGGVER